MDDEDIDKGLKMIIGEKKVIRELDNFRLWYFMKDKDGISWDYLRVKEYLSLNKSDKVDEYL